MPRFLSSLLVALLALLAPTHALTTDTALTTRAHIETTKTSETTSLHTAQGTGHAAHTRNAHSTRAAHTHRARTAHAQGGWARAGAAWAGLDDSDPAWACWADGNRACSVVPLEHAGIR
jgi:hypothetical protein